MFTSTNGVQVKPSTIRAFVKFFRTSSVPKTKELPSEGLPVIGSLLSFIKSGSSPKLHLYIDEKHRRLGPLFREVMPSRSTIFLAEPDKIREVFTKEGKCPGHFLPESWLLYNKTYHRKRGLLFMDKEEWLYYRKIMNQFLLVDDIAKELSSVYEDVIDSLISIWKLNVGSCLNDVAKFLYLCSISFMMATATGTSYSGCKRLFEDDLKSLAISYQKIFETTSNLMVLPVNLVSTLNLPVWQTFVSAMKDSLDSSETVICKMKKYKSKEGLLQKMSDAGISDKMSTILLTDLMIAAGDTTANTLQWALYLLGRDQMVQQKALENEDIIKGVIKETLRLYPGAPFLSRVIQQPLEVAGYNIPAGELVVMSMYTCGRSDKYFPNASQFSPDRWKRDANGHLKGVTNKFASLPFAMGVRSCVGKKLAESLMILTIKKILANFKIRTVKDVDMVLRLTPVPSQDIKLFIENR